MTHINKYLQCKHQFFDRTVDIEVAVKRNERATMKLLEKARKDEELAELMLTVNETNEAVLKLLEWNKQFLQEIMNDSKALIEGAKVRDLIRDLRQTVEANQNYITQLENETIGIKRTITPSA